MKEQGVMIECVYCKYIRPELKGTKKCPECHGLTPKLREAQVRSLAAQSRDDERLG